MWKILEERPKVTKQYIEIILISPVGKTILAVFFSKFKFNKEQNVPAEREYLPPVFSKSSILKKIEE